MKASENEELTDLELSEMLAAWRVPDPPHELRGRVFVERRIRITATLEEPRYERLLGNVRDFVRRSRFVVVGFAIQAGAVAFLCLAVRSPLTEKSKPSSEAISIAFYHSKVAAARKAAGGGGGGQLAPTPVGKGAAPEFAAKQFMPPAVAVPVPELPVVPTITAPAPVIDALTYGDPLAKLNSGSPGQGVNGIGEGKGGGVGNGDGGGYGSGEGGGVGGGVYRSGGDVSSPVLISKVEPEYSEDARRAKYSGMVVLSVVVDEHGVPRNIQVVRSLGLGLDEKAVQAVSRWRFRPGYRHGIAVSVLATVEVNFRLL